MDHRKMSSYRGYIPLVSQKKCHSILLISFIMNDFVKQKQEMSFDHGYIICVLQEKMSFNYG